MQKTFDERRTYMFNRLSKVSSVKVFEPKGAFYVFIDISALYGKKFNGEVIDGSLSFAKAALNNGVAVIPGIAFGDDNCIRLSYAISIEDIKEGLDRLEGFINALN
jgi:aspartate aminotransferase